MGEANEQEVIAKFNQMRQDVMNISTKINELDMEKQEHQLVVDAIQPLDKDRKCFRLIGGVLVERTVGEVIPAIARNKEGLDEVTSRLGKSLEAKKKELADFQEKYKIRIKGEDGPADAGEETSAKAQGVLV
mmetsp:Transcript_3092/g.10441  ORF Transcript_3092/g.10441 Transcript_3092/m.10441 type:complete len:132 (+) Transcript_3092:158-553(+)